MEALGRPRDAAGFHHRAKNLKCGQVHLRCPLESRWVSS
jgi:hypothetical protein